MMDQVSSLVDRNRSMAVGTAVAGVVMVGTMAYLISRSGQKRRPADLAGKVTELARDVVGDDPLEAGQEFLMKQVLPELKPVLLAIVDDLEKVVTERFNRAEKAIKKL